MKRTLPLLLILFLAACAPAQVALPTSTAIPATATLPATATPTVVEPTATALPPTATASPARVDFDYAIIPGSETTADLDGYPVSIAVHTSMSSKFRDIEFSDPKVFADLMWEVEYQAWLGHKPEAEGKSLAEFKDLVAKAKAGDQQARKDLTYVFPLNNMDDGDGYKYQNVTILPLIGGGWTPDGVLQPDETRVVVVDTRKVENISPKGQMGDGYGFSYMVEDGKVIEIIYVAGARDGLVFEDLEWNIGRNLALLIEYTGKNQGALKYPAGNPLADEQKSWESKLMGAMELKK